jgi:hypothetical protein
LPFHVENSQLVNSDNTPGEHRNPHPLEYQALQVSRPVGTPNDKGLVGTIYSTGAMQKTEIKSWGNHATFSKIFRRLVFESGRRPHCR